MQTRAQDELIMAQRIEKAKVWLAVTYPENMVEGWEEDAPDILQGIPFAYCIHNKDTEGHSLAEGEELPDNLRKYLHEQGARRCVRKVHVHWIISLKDVKEGTTTRKHATDIMNQFSKAGRTCCPGCEACINLRYAYDYLIHDTENAQKKGKHLYDLEERVTGNTFDIERMVSISAEQKLMMSQELCDFIIERQIKDTSDLYVKMCEEFGDSYYEIYKANNAMYDRLCRGVFNKSQRKSKALETPGCSVCGSKAIVGHYETEEGFMWFCQACQETAYVFVSQMEGDEEAASEVKAFHLAQMAG